MLRQTLKKFFDRAFSKRLGHEAFDANILEFKIEAHLPRKDNKLATDIRAGQIVARIGLGKTFPTRFLLRSSHLGSPTWGSGRQAARLPYSLSASSAVNVSVSRYALTGKGES